MSYRHMTRMVTIVHMTSGVSVIDTAHLTSRATTGPLRSASKLTSEEDGACVASTGFPPYPVFTLHPLVRLCYSLCETHRHSALKVAQTRTCCCCRQPRSDLPSWKAL